MHESAIGGHDQWLPRCRSNIGIGNEIVGSFLLVLNSMALYAIWNMLCNLISVKNSRLLILSSAQTCSICPDRVTGETKAVASQCELRKGHDGRRNYDAHRVVRSAKILEFFKDLFYSASLFE